MTMQTKRTFVGFGFGAIQAGLFLYEAHKSGRFTRLVVAEVMPESVAALKRNGGGYGLNVADPDGIRRESIAHVEILNPNDERDRARLIEAIAEADELATALPSVKFYGTGGSASVIDLLTAGWALRAYSAAPQPAVLYTAENHNHAAEILGEALTPALGGNPTLHPVQGIQILNTVIGKMSGAVSDPGQIREQNLIPITSTADRCFLVEAFNRILISRIQIPGFQRGISVFEEKDNLLPFEEAKLYGHNATHALLGFLAQRRGLTFISQAANHPDLMAIARDAFLNESGAALCRKYPGLDPLFSPRGYQAYVDNLLPRMINPHLRDAVDRVIRDPQRKLGWEDRLIGTLRLVRQFGGQPRLYALGAAAARLQLTREVQPASPPDWSELWGADRAHSPEGGELINLINTATVQLGEKGL